jgi:uncharacterized protein YbaA (DUF1428 family)
MVQETYDSHPAIRAACREGIESHARTLVPMIAQAKALHAPDADWNAENLALYTQAALQGAFVVAKAQGNSSIAVQFIAHLRSYVQSLLTPHKQASGNALETYIDGYVMAVPLANKAEYIRHVQENIRVWKQYGALRVMECWADDVPSGRINSYGHAVHPDHNPMPFDVKRMLRGGFQTIVSG